MYLGKVLLAFSIVILSQLVSAGPGSGGGNIVEGDLVDAATIELALHEVVLPLAIMVAGEMSKDQKFEVFAPRCHQWNVKGCSPLKYPDIFSAMYSAKIVVTKSECPLPKKVKGNALKSENFDAIATTSDTGEMTVCYSLARISKRRLTHENFLKVLVGLAVHEYAHLAGESHPENKKQTDKVNQLEKLAREKATGLSLEGARAKIWNWIYSYEKEYQRLLLKIYSHAEKAAVDSQVLCRDFINIYKQFDDFKERMKDPVRGAIFSPSIGMYLVTMQLKFENLNASCGPIDYLQYKDDPELYGLATELASRLAPEVLKSRFKGRKVMSMKEYGELAGETTSLSHEQVIRLNENATELWDIYNHLTYMHASIQEFRKLNTSLLYLNRNAQ